MLPLRIMPEEVELCFQLEPCMLGLRNVPELG